MPPRPIIIPHPRGWDWDPANFRSPGSITPLSSVDWDPFPPAPTEGNYPNPASESGHSSGSDKTDAAEGECGEVVGEASVTATQQKVAQWQANIEPVADREPPTFVEAPEDAHDDIVDEKSEESGALEQPRQEEGVVHGLDEERAVPASKAADDEEVVAQVKDEVPAYDDLN